MYCCGVTADRHRPKELKVEDISIPLTDDEQFRQFDKLIQPPFRSGMHGSLAHATLVGRFFSGRLIKYPKGSSWGGYGHMGCCTLFAIQGVKAVDSQNRGDLDYGAGFDQPDIGKVGCGYRFLTPIDSTADSIKTQQPPASPRRRLLVIERRIGRSLGSRTLPSSIWHTCVSWFPFWKTTASTCAY